MTTRYVIPTSTVKQTEPEFITTGGYFFYVRQQSLSCIDKLPGTWNFPAHINSNRFKPQQVLPFLTQLALFFLWRAQFIHPASPIRKLYRPCWYQSLTGG